MPNHPHPAARSERPPLALTRKPERGVPDRAALDGFLDTQWWGVLAVGGPAGSPPVAVPTLYLREGDDLVFHASTGAGALGRRGAATAATFCVTVMDALVVAHTTFDSSANYRSAVISGELEAVTDRDPAKLLRAFGDAIIPGRSGETRDFLRKEIAATHMSRLRITDGQWLLKERRGQAGEPDEETRAWGGVVPISTVYGEPEAAPWSQAEVPASVRTLVATSAAPEV